MAIGFLIIAQTDQAQKFFKSIQINNRAEVQQMENAGEFLCWLTINDEKWLIPKNYFSIENYNAHIAPQA